jgi:hypothetical protein
MHPARSLFCAAVLLGGFLGRAAGEIISQRTLFQDGAVYAAWPALVRAANGDLVLAFARTEQHLGPDGAIVTMRSTDNGTTWSPPTVAYDSPLDDRECGLTVGPDGCLLLHVWSTFWKRESYASLAPGSYPRETIERWIKHVDAPAYRAAEKQQGAHVLISRDSGLTWSKPLPGPDSVHGGITLHDGSLLTASYREEVKNISLCAATVSEGPWTLRHIIRTPAPERLHFGEPHLVQLPTGRILVMIRATAAAYDDQRDDLFLWETYSDDNGQTWAKPFPTPLWGFPPHLTVLCDGRVLVTYGYRRKPFGERAALSADGVTWDASQVIVLRDDAPNLDLGYPASLEISPGTVLTVYYQKPALDPADKHRHRTAIMATLWRVPPR